MPLVVRATAALLAVAVSEQGAAAPVSKAAAGASPIPRRPDAFIDDRLADLSLDADTVCAALNLSRSALPRAFPGAGVASALGRKRLDSVRRVLADPDDGQSIAQIAFNHGFTDANYFHSLFQRYFGCSLAAYRRMVSAGGAAEPERGTAPAFREWLTALTEAAGDRPSSLLRYGDVAASGPS